MAINTAALTTLRACLDAAKEAVISGEINFAIDACFHVLSYYPKHIEAHCLLGEAYREKGLVDQAEETFRRVLSADPENLIARWALSILEEDEGDIEAAYWDLQRAFELSPGHKELRYELTRLSGEEPPLTRGALGRIYAKGELFDRAIREFRGVLATDPNRLDVVVALAETLWRCERHPEARVVCEQALAISPDCLKANVILGLILISSKERETGEMLLDRAQALDPENNMAAQILDGMDAPTILEKTEVEIPPFEPIAVGSGTVSVKSDGEATRPDGQIFGKDSIFGDLTDLDTDAVSSVQVEEPSAAAVPTTEWEFLDLGEHEARDEADEVPGADDEQEPSLAEVAETPSLETLESQAEDVIAETTFLETLETQDEDAIAESPELETLETPTEDVIAESAELETLETPTEDVIAESAEVEEYVEAQDEPLQFEEFVKEKIEPVEEPEEELELETEPGAADVEIEETAEAPREDVAETAAVAANIHPQRMQAPPQDYQASIDRAVAYENAGQIEEAVKEFELVLKSSPEMTDRVIEGLKALLKSNPKYSPANRTLGDAYMKIGRFQQAIDCYNKCLKK